MSTREKALRNVDKNKILAFLQSHPVATLGTTNSDSSSHLTIIYFCVGKNFEIMFTTKRNTKKHTNITQNNNVSLITYEAFSQTTVQISGSATEIKSIHLAGEVFRNTLKSSLKTSGIGIPPVSKMYAGDYVAYRIKPDHLRMTVYSRANPSNYEIYDHANFITSLTPAVKALTAAQSSG